MRRAFYLLFQLSISMLLIAACKPFVTSTPSPSPQPIQIFYTATLRPRMQILHECALEHPEIALITEERSATNLEFSSGEVILRFGEPSQGISGYAISLGEDKIVIVAGEKVALRELSAEQLSEFYSKPTPVYQVWTYNEGNELRTIFDTTVLGEVPPSSNLQLAPDPTAMLEAIVANPMAIGYVPKSWLTGNIQRISLERELQDAFKHPILALTVNEPEGRLKNYLSCLQQNINP